MKTIFKQTPRATSNIESSQTHEEAKTYEISMIKMPNTIIDPG